MGGVKVGMRSVVGGVGVERKINNFDLESDDTSALPIDQSWREHVPMGKQKVSSRHDWERASELPSNENSTTGCDKRPITLRQTRFHSRSQVPHKSP